MKDGVDCNLQLYKGKDGYRWRFIINGNIKCIGTDPQGSRKEAFDDANEILGNEWDVGEYPGDEK